MRIWLAGGGTGGHLCPGMALADELCAMVPDIDIGFLGTNEGLDREILWGSGYKLVLLAAGRGSPVSLSRPLNAPRFAWALKQVFTMFRGKNRPDAVVALGGYAAGAPGRIAGLLGIPLIILEQNTIPGRANRWLAKWASQVHSQFAEAKPHFARLRGEFFHSGSPLREPFKRLAGEKPVSGDSLLVVGGSQGARRLNEIVVEAARRITGETGCRIIHVAGPANESAVRSGYAKAGVMAEVYGFHNNMEELYKRSRLVIARSGAISLAEFAAAGLPAVLVPLPSSMDDHQRINSRVIVDAGAAVNYEETTARLETFAPLVVSLWKDEARRSAMAEAMRGTARPDAGAWIAEKIVDLVQSRKGGK